MDQERFEDLAKEIADISRWLYAQGWSPATSSNYSARIEADEIAITTSGKDKGKLTPQDVMALTIEKDILIEGKPSAETGLHLQLYRHFESCGAVLHTHSPLATILSRHIGAGNFLELSQFELAKAIEGVKTHDVTLEIPVFQNNQDIDALAEEVQVWLNQSSSCYAYLIEGHGTYVWGKDLGTCRRHLEALEFLFTCAWHERV